MSEEEEEVIIDWKTEAKGVITDISAHVSHVSISDKVGFGCPSSVYLNLETLEGERFTVKLSSSGFAVVGKSFDNNQLEIEEGRKTFETVYALLQSLSPKYVGSFAGRLQSKLLSLVQLQEQNGEKEADLNHLKED